MTMTTAEKYKLNNLVESMTSAKIAVEMAQEAANCAVRDYRLFLDSITSSDDPIPTPAKRAYNRRPKPAPTALRGPEWSAAVGE